MNNQYNPFGSPVSPGDINEEQRRNADPPIGGQNAAYTPPQQNTHFNVNAPPNQGYDPGYYQHSQQGMPFNPQNGYNNGTQNWGGQYGYPPVNPAFVQELAKKRDEKREIRKFGNWVGIAIMGYLFIQTVFALLLQPFNLNELYSSSSVFQSCFNIIAVSFLSVALPFGIIALINKRHYTQPLVPAEKIKFSNLALWVSFGMLCCIGANYFVSNLIIPIFKQFGYQLTQNEMVKPDSIFACVVSLIATAIIPPICEEFAMRCCSAQLLRKYGKAFAVIAVSIVFGLLHGNVIQFVFAFLVGLALGYVTVKTNSILPAILIHAFNNGMSVISDIVTFASAEKYAGYATAGIYIFWAVVGVAALIILAVKKQFKREKPKEDTGLSLGSKLFTFFFVPGMIIPFISLITLTLTTIKS